VLATWSFTGETGSQSTTSGSAGAAGVVAGDFTRASALNSATGSGSINSSNWATSAQVDTSKYYALTVSPPHGCTMSITALAIDAKASGTGPASAELASDDDSFSHKTTFAPNATSSPSLSITGATGAVEIRLYGYSATGATGTMRIQNTFSVSGSLQ
jgi:hypothetical protein